MRPLDRAGLLPEPGLPRGADLLAEGRRLARDWQVGPCAFLGHYAVACEADYKLSRMAAGEIMQHAQIGFRDRAKSLGAYRRIWEECEARGVRVDRYGLCLDWSMALPRAARAGATRGTGMILRGPEDFAALTAAAPVAPHFGDFVLGFPAAVENTQAALAAGSTAIGNLGQYFTFRIPGHADDIAAARATVIAIGLIAAQPVRVLVHSNIDDGYGAQFNDLATCLGQILLERDLIEGLAGAPVGHCFGHHFSDPLTRLAFQRALVREGAPGTLIYGNTTAYRGTAAENYAGLARYLTIDALGQALAPSGHAINAVPVSENLRIPDVDEVIEAQLFAGRLVRDLGPMPALIDLAEVDRVAQALRAGAERYRAAVMAGLAAAGVDTGDLFQMLLALRRIGGRGLEARFGPGAADAAAPGGRRPLVAATILHEIAGMAEAALAPAAAADLARIAGRRPRVLVASTDVHEHGKLLIEEMLRRIGAEALDGGVSTDAEVLAEAVRRLAPDAVALSTYNGVALGYFTRLKALLLAAGASVPVLIGGRLNQIPEGSNTSLPLDVGAELAAAGALVCRDAAELTGVLASLPDRE
jgi:methylmalonyl-CoA mutase cobalamin-binding subunit